MKKVTLPKQGSVRGTGLPTTVKKATRPPRSLLQTVRGTGLPTTITTVTVTKATRLPRSWDNRYHLSKARKSCATIGAARRGSPGLSTTI
jgi:hypothetical protein